MIQHLTPAAAAAGPRRDRADTVAFAAWRRFHWAQDLSAVPGGDLLGRLARAEYGGSWGRLDAVLSVTDRRTARLRQLARRERAVPAWVLAAAGAAPDLQPWERTALAESWEHSARLDAGASATAEIRRRLLADPGPAQTEFLLDVADANGLRPLSPAEAVGRPAASRPAVHALWRYLSGLPGGHLLLPEPDRCGDAYERLLLAACAHRADPGAPSGRRFRAAFAALAEPRPRPMVVAQSMLLGRLEEPGAGLSGGMSVLLTGLGEALTADERITRVLTLTTARPGEVDRADLTQASGRSHLLVRLPVDTPAPLDPHTATVHQAALAWWTARVFELPGARPDLAHVRFADDASLAVARAAGRHGSALAFTVTPDPHRTIEERHAGLPADHTGEAAQALRLDLHRVFVADRLVARADLLVAMPAQSGTQELSSYFPQLADRPVHVQPEGIAPFRPAAGDGATTRGLLARLYGGDGDGGVVAGGLDAGDRGLPLLLCVGRLHPVKQQEQLVRAWMLAGLHHRTTLLLIGGSPDQPTAVEADVLDRIGALLATDPVARRRTALWPALPNRQVRLLERALAQGRPGAALYVCPSAKEEFGLAVLEAMEAGLAVAAPQRGGASHYLRDGVNGRLLATESVDRLADGLRSLLDTPVPDLVTMARAGAVTVRERFGIDTMAASLAQAYRVSCEPVLRERCRSAE
ncbi:D-inositol-3-phosphate glycosyltransferase [Kitasatospora sp. MMS16-BH015]|uniref:glycosyltransferase family 4 protein n=1 Tax=Kitasatospora sp. MMS16-BH015 TaxID=2018025 RepID=UPI000CA11F65|nr:glycosyltransferase family 4 protein [Kitasatospora sp. MMS16-BH015]AUG75898.1 D-inositol-3-phosphate glycosyltransferase [Kitasatospora sp. MMS16-BH015]